MLREEYLVKPKVFFSEYNRLIDRVNHKKVKALCPITKLRIHDSVLPTLGLAKQDLWGLGAWSRVIVYCSKLSFCQNDPPMGSAKVQ